MPMMKNMKTYMAIVVRSHFCTKHGATCLGRQARTQAQRYSSPTLDKLSRPLSWACIEDGSQRSLSQLHNMQIRILPFLNGMLQMSIPSVVVGVLMTLAEEFKCSILYESRVFSFFQSFYKDTLLDLDQCARHHSDRILQADGFSAFSWNTPTPLLLYLHQGHDLIYGSKCKAQK